MKCISFVEIMSQKRGNISGKVIWKIRLAARGNMHRNVHLVTHSPAAGTTEMSKFISILKIIETYLFQGVVSSAYLINKLDEVVHLLPSSVHVKTKDNFFGCTLAHQAYTVLLC